MLVGAQLRLVETWSVSVRTDRRGYGLCGFPQTLILLAHWGRAGTRGGIVAPTSYLGPVTSLHPHPIDPVPDETAHTPPALDEWPATPDGPQHSDDAVALVLEPPPTGA